MVHYSCISSVFPIKNYDYDEMWDSTHLDDFKLYLLHSSTYRTLNTKPPEEISEIFYKQNKKGNGIMSFPRFSIFIIMKTIKTISFHENSSSNSVLKSLENSSATQTQSEYNFQSHMLFLSSVLVFPRLACYNHILILCEMSFI